MLAAPIRSFAVVWRRRWWLARGLAMVLVLVATAVAAALVKPAPVVADAPAVATVLTDSTLLAAPAPDAAVLCRLPAGTEVFLTGSAAPGFLEATVGAERGWIAAGDLSISGTRAIQLATATGDAPILASPRPDAEPLGRVPAGGVVILTGADVGTYVAGSYEGTGGWIAEADLGLPYDRDSIAR